MKTIEEIQKELETKKVTSQLDPIFRREDESIREGFILALKWVLSDEEYI